MRKGKRPVCTDNGANQTIVHVKPEFVANEISQLLKPGNTQETPYSFKVALLQKSLLSKYSDNPHGEHLREAAVETFNSGEFKCKAINEAGLDIDESTYNRARYIIARILGPFSYEKVLRYGRFSGGASSHRPRAFGHPVYKYSDDPTYYSRSKKRIIRGPKYLTCTPLAFKYWAALCDTTMLESKNKPLLVKGNVIDFVPKNNKTHRTIAKEPDCNMFLQLGAGEYIARRLLMFNISKYDQSINQRLARIGSIDGSLSTLDLKSASDSISWRFVHEMLPPDWFKYLDDIRSHYYMLNGTWSLSEKFSTMGNGFTFELETLLFLAISAASSNCCFTDFGTALSVYGDDIICRSNKYTEVVNALTGCGFTINEDKSFNEGPYRESCGEHFYNGHRVTPFFIRKPIDSPQRLCWLLNNIRKWSYCEQVGVCDDSLYPLWKSLVTTYRALYKKLRGGSDVNRTDYIVSKGINRYHLVERRSKIVLDDYYFYLCRMAQGLFTAGDDLLYHCIGTPDSGSTLSLIAKSSEIEINTVSLKYTFCEEV